MGQSFTLRASVVPRLSILLTFSLAAVTRGQATRPADTRPADTRPAAQADVPVREVVLFSSGVGYFEHFGTVTGNDVTVLRFKTEQVNDILKSLLLEDLDGGRVGTVSYPSQAPLARTLRSFQVDITNNPPLADLLNELRGARLTVTTTAGPIEGSILGVEKKRKVINEKETVEVSVLNLRSGRTIRPVPLDDVQLLSMDDPKLNDELDAALSTLAQARDQEKKPVEIHFNGKGERRVRVGYVVETPVWKTSYRLVLDPKPENAKEKPAGGKLQGWAIVENQTDNDWKNVQLSLVSGRPISFIEDLYHSLYVPRPFIQPQLFATLQPQTYENGISMEEMNRMQQMRNATNEQLQQGGAQNNGQAAAQRGAQVGNQLFAGGGQNMANQAAAAAEAPIDPTASVVAAASASKLGELFQYTVGSVDINRQQSAMIPIVTDDVDAQKVSIYNPAVLPNHPLNGVRLKNTTRKHLLQGPVTVIEAGSYAGDAQIDDIPPDQRRLISYGVDLKVLVQRDDDPPESALMTAKIVKGVMDIRWRDVAQESYLIDNRSDHEKTIVVERPRTVGWTLIDPAKPDETTESLYRFDRKVGGFKVAKFVVRQETERTEQVQVLPTDPNRLEVYVKLDRLPKSVRDALSRVIADKQALADTQGQLQNRRKRIDEITTEQTRIREDVKAVAPSTDYYARLVKKLNDQETLIETLQKEASELLARTNAQQAALEKSVADLNVDAASDDRH